jgi:hypothetical protein
MLLLPLIPSSISMCKQTNIPLPQLFNYSIQRSRGPRLFTLDVQTPQTHHVLLHLCVHSDQWVKPQSSKALWDQITLHAGVSWICANALLLSMVHTFLHSSKQRKIKHQFGWVKLARDPAQGCHAGDSRFMDRCSIS